ncbi:hypothetical protein R3P38DRAFT_2772245 [Favolaschia claudopus]|uniref:Uncharacterized protein n=1 Tax=Favolaschia claudopus TaxID=2862362 RepID=A0AAW0C676_9AGAR
MFDDHISPQIKARVEDLGRPAVVKIDNGLSQFSCLLPYEDKSWNFPKFHARQHAFDDIKNKGAARNFGTKPSESMHKAIRDTYHQMTNFKDVTPQIVKHDHRRAVATFVREQIDAIDAELKEQEDPDDVEPTILSNVDVGSKLKQLSFSALEQQMTEDDAFQRFRIKFGDFISTFLPAFGYPLPGGKRLKFDGKDMFLKVHYESLSSWCPATDFLR